MSLGTNLRALRKARGLTQEQIAAAVGVSKPAVSKWESDSSYPDITLLAPLARFFEITIDTLLSYHVSLTNQQTHEITQQLQTLLYSGDFAQAKCYSDHQLHQYPNIGELKLLFAQEYFQFAVLCSDPNSQRTAFDESQALLLSISNSKSTDTALQESALTCLAQHALLMGAYDQALDAALQLPQDRPDVQLLLASIHLEAGDSAECQKICQDILLRSYKTCDLCFGLLEKSAATEGNLQDTMFLLEKHLTFTQLFEMHCGQSLYLELAEVYARSGNPNRALHALEQYTDFLCTSQALPCSNLFGTIDLDDAVNAPVEQSVYAGLADYIQTDSIFAAVRDLPAFRRVIDRLRQRSASAG